MTRTRIGVVVATVAGLAGSAAAQGAQPSPPTPTPPAPAPVPPAGEEQTPPADEGAPTDAPAELPAPEPAPEPEAPAMPEKLKVGKEGFFQPGILMQGWFFVDRADAPATSSFRLRRAEIHLKGEIIPEKVAYAIMIDPAKVLEFQNVDVGGTPVKQPVTAVSVMQDFYFTYKTKWVDASIGQFKIPVSWEGYNSSSKLLFPERAAVSRTFGDKRDLGVRLTKTFEKVMYSAGVFNGAGLNNLDGNNAKDVGLRLEYYPVKGATIGGVGYATVGDRDESGAKDRWELDARYEKDAILFQSEAIVARDVDAMGAAHMARGFYAAGAYKLENNVQTALRVGALEPNADADDDEQMSAELGVNYYFREHQAKLQGSYSLTVFKDDAKQADHFVILAAQVSY